MSGAKSRRKGAAGEREFLRLASEALGDTYRRNLEQVRSGGGDAHKPVGAFCVEIKNQARLNVRLWWQQAVAQAKAGGLIPALAYKVARHGWLIVVPMPEAWATGNCWRESYDYTSTLQPSGFWFRVRECGYGVRLYTR